MRLIAASSGAARVRPKRKNKAKMKNQDVINENIGVLEHGKSCFTVLVEEEPLVRRIWEDYYRKNEWPLQVFENPLDFLDQIEHFSNRKENMYFFFDQDFGRIRGVGLQLARAVKKRNAHQTVSLVTNHCPSYFEDEIRSRLIQNAFDKYPEVIFGRDYLLSALQGRPDLWEMMCPPREERVALERAMNFNGDRLAFTLEEHFPSFAPKPKLTPLPQSPVQVGVERAPSIPMWISIWKRFRARFAQFFAVNYFSDNQGRYLDSDAFQHHWQS